MGHLVCAQAVAWAIETARKYGTAAVTTRNHFHFGAAGMWTRMAADAGFIALSMSSHRSPLTPGASIESLHTVSPMSIGLPAGAQPPINLDMASHINRDFSAEDWFAESPSMFLKDLVRLVHGHAPQLRWSFKSLTNPGGLT
jgi:hypothetical protein